MTEEDSDNFIRRMAEYEKISAILWLVLAIFQIICIITIVAGVWNLVAAISRFQMVKEIRNRNPAVPAAYEGVTMLIVIGFINFFLGAAIGVVFVAFDFYIRDQILKNQAVFSEGYEPSSSLPMFDFQGVIAKLESIGDLRDNGTLSASEFQTEKTKILAPLGISYKNPFEHG